MIDRLQKLMNMTTSENDGEALNAIRRANDLLKKNGKSWEDFIKERPRARSFTELSDAQIVDFLNKKASSANKKERIYATMLLAMGPKMARYKMDEFWSLK
jgi:hypothetical protein